MPLLPSATMLSLVDSMAILLAHAYQLARARLASAGSPVLRLLVQRDQEGTEGDLVRRGLEIFRSRSNRDWTLLEDCPGPRNARNWLGEKPGSAIESFKTPAAVVDEESLWKSRLTSHRADQQRRNAMGAGKPWLWALLAPAVLLLAVADQAGHAQDRPSNEGANPLPKAKPDKQSGEPGEARVKGGVYLGKYAELIEELDLTEEQQLKLAGLVLYQAVLGQYQSAVPSPHPKGAPKTVAADQPPDPLQLTDAQKRMIKNLCLDAVKQPQVTVAKEKGRGGVLDRVMRDVRERVLSDEQSDALAGAELQQQVMGRALAGLSVKGNAALKLSDEQLAQIRAICQAAARDVAPADDWKVNAEVMQGVVERVQDVLTPEQREEVNKQLEARRAEKVKGGDVQQPSGDKGKKPLGRDGEEGK